MLEYSIKELQFDKAEIINHSEKIVAEIQELIAHRIKIKFISFTEKEGEKEEIKERFRGIVKKGNLVQSLDNLGLTLSGDIRDDLIRVLFKIILYSKKENKKFILKNIEMDGLNDKDISLENVYFRGLLEKEVDLKEEQNA